LSYFIEYESPIVSIITVIPAQSWGNWERRWIFTYDFTQLLHFYTLFWKISLILSG